MLYILEKVMNATMVSIRLGKLLMEQMVDEEWKHQLTSYLEYEQKQYEVWQYTYFLTIGKYYQKKSGDENVGESSDEMMKTALFNEINKAMLYYELWAVLFGAQKSAAERALQRALEHGYLFFTMMQIHLTDQIQQ
jgi:hypothetical protein